MGEATDRAPRAVIGRQQAFKVSPEDPVIYIYRGEARLGLGLIDRANGTVRGQGAGA